MLLVYAFLAFSFEQAFALSLIIGWSNVSKAIDHTCNAILLDKVQYFQLSILQEWKNVIKHLFEI